MLARTVTPQCDAGRAHEAQASDQGWTSNLCDTENDRGAGLRPDQTGPRVSPVPLARLGQSSGRVGAGLSHPQHFEVASALLRVTIIKLMDAMAQMPRHFQPAGRTGTSQNSFTVRIINS